LEPKLSLNIIRCQPGDKGGGEKLVGTASGRISDLLRRSKAAAERHQSSGAEHGIELPVSRRTSGQDVAVIGGASGTVQAVIILSISYGPVRLPHVPPIPRIERCRMHVKSIRYLMHIELAWLPYFVCMFHHAE
jgi:hypothetical protein